MALFKKINLVQYMNHYVPLIFLLSIYGCQSNRQSEIVNNLPDNESPNYLRHVGDIAFDKNIDDPDFILCDENKIAQYFNYSDGFQYDGEKIALINTFKNNYEEVETEETGMIRIRFVVNCDGQSDRFRLISMSSDYQSMVFDERITAQLMSISKSLTGWKKVFDSTSPIDYYQYLIFKINNGQIIEILP